MATGTKATDEKKTTATAYPWDFTYDRLALTAKLEGIERQLKPLEANLNEERAKVDQKALAAAVAKREALWAARNEALRMMKTALADAYIASGAYLYLKEDRERFESNHFRPSQVNPAFITAVRNAVGLADGEDLGDQHYLLGNIVHEAGEKFAETYGPYLRAKGLYEALEGISPYTDEEKLRAGIRKAEEAMEHLMVEAGAIRNILAHIKAAEETNPKTKKGRQARAAMAAQLIYGRLRLLDWTTKPCNHCGHINDHQAKGAACRDCTGRDGPCEIAVPTKGGQ